MSFDDTKYIVVKDVINKETIELLQLQAQMLEDVMCCNNNTTPDSFKFGDSQVSNSFSYYGALFTDSLLILLQSVIETHVNRKLFPTYSYMRIYYQNAILKKHVDRPSCEYSATVCIKCNKQEPWEIKFEDLSNNEISIMLNEGDIIIYKGDELPHWRNECKYDKHIQFFLHYVDADGIYSDYKYDGRKMLGLQRD